MTNKICAGDRLTGCCLAPKMSNITRRTSYIRSNDDVLSCVIDQYGWLKFTVVAHGSNSSWVDMSLQWEILS
jgi:hypothetical protein